MHCRHTRLHPHRKQGIQPGVLPDLPKLGREFLVLRRRPDKTCENLSKELQDYLWVIRTLLHKYIPISD